MNEKQIDRPSIVSLYSHYSCNVLCNHNTVLLLLLLLLLYYYCYYYSIVLFDVVYISDVVPKTYYDQKEEAYLVSITVCVNVVSEPTSQLTVQINAQAQDMDYTITGVSFQSLPSCG